MYLFRRSIRKGGRRMIELKIEGVCKECPFRNLTLIEYNDPPEVRCKHDHVCKFVGDPNGKEGIRAAVAAERLRFVTWDDMERENNA